MVFRIETAEPPSDPVENITFCTGVLPNRALHNLHSSRNIFGVFRWEVHVAHMRRDDTWYYLY